MSLSRVAEVAAVSYATAWRAVNHDPAVSEEVARRVHDAVERLGYIPTKRRSRRDKTAEGIRTRNIALLLLRTGATVAPPILHEIERLLREQDMNLIFACLEPGKPLPEAVRRGNVDGILGYGEFPGDAITPRLKSVPAVWMMSRFDTGRDAWGDRVKPDSEAIGDLAARYLHKQGHRQLGYMRLEPQNVYEQERLRGFMMTAAELAAQVQVFRPAADDSINMRVRAEHVVAQWQASSPRPGGVFIATDREAEYIYWQLEDRGVDIGRDLEVVSCDNDQQILQRLHPQPVSIDINREAVAQVAVDRLMWRMKHGMHIPPLVIHITPHLSGVEV